MHYHFDLTTTTTIAIYAGAVVYLVDRKTGQVVGVIPLDKKMMSYIDTLGALTEVLSSTKDMKGAEMLRTEAAKLLATVVEKVSEELPAKPKTHAA